MLDPELLEILVCPDTKAPVHLAEKTLLEKVNRAVAEGSLETRAGEKVGEPLEAGLVRDDGKVLYPIREGIPIMLVDEAIELEKLG
jgi:uncharacterized protein